MKRLLLPLLVALALPTAVNADVAPYYLIIDKGAPVPMKSMEACERALDKVLVKTNWKWIKRANWPVNLNGICLKSE